MNTKKILRIILAVLAGEIALILFTTIAQEVFFDGINFRTSSWFDIIVGGALTFLAAILAGGVARWVSKANYKAVPIAISILIITEMTYLIKEGIATGPLWFDIMAGGSLVVGIWMGYNYRKIFTPLLPSHS